MVKEEGNSFLREVTLERNSLLAELNRVKLRKSEQEIQLLKSQNTKLQKGLNEKTIVFIREKIRELSSNKKELSNNQQSNKIPVFFSQPSYVEENECRELSDLDNLLQRATSAIIDSKRT